MPTFWKKGKTKIKITTADKWFSKFIRIRDAYDSGFCSCITCGVPRHWKGIQCGHYMKRGKIMTRFNEQNCHAQCATCNGQNEGEQGIHGLKIDEMYGLGTAQNLVNLSKIRGAKEYTKLALKDIAKEYRLKAKKLAKEKGIEL